MVKKKRIICNRGEGFVLKLGKWKQGGVEKHMNPCWAAASAATCLNCASMGTKFVESCQQCQPRKSIYMFMQVQKHSHLLNIYYFCACFLDT